MNFSREQIEEMQARLKEAEPYIQQMTEHQIEELVWLLGLDETEVRAAIAHTLDITYEPLWKVVDVIVTFHRCLHQGEKRDEE